MVIRDAAYREFFKKAPQNYRNITFILYIEFCYSSYRNSHQFCNVQTFPANIFDKYLTNIWQTSCKYFLNRSWHILFALNVLSSGQYITYSRDCTLVNCTLPLCIARFMLFLYNICNRVSHWESFFIKVKK